jgi:ParB family chromosome partitioning protein
MRDVRIFSNTLDRAMQGMIRAGIPAFSEKNETDEYIEYLVRIPKRPEKAG